MGAPDFASLDAQVAMYSQEMQHTVKFEIAVTEFEMSTDFIGGKVVIHFQDGSTMEGHLLEASVYSEGPSSMAQYHFAKQQQMMAGYSAGPNKMAELYKKFAEGIELSDDFKKEIFGEWISDDTTYTSGEICGNGWESPPEAHSGSVLALPHQGGGSEIDGDETLAILKNAIPGFADMMVRFPVEDAKINKPIPLYSAIVTLNDSYKWTREEIADWLETLDLDLTIRPVDDVEGDEAL